MGASDPHNSRNASRSAARLERRTEVAMRTPSIRFESAPENPLRSRNGARYRTTFTREEKIRITRGQSGCSANRRSSGGWLPGPTSQSASFTSSHAIRWNEDPYSRASTYPSFGSGFGRRIVGFRKSRSTRAILRPCRLCHSEWST